MTPGRQERGGWRQRWREANRWRVVCIEGRRNVEEERPMDQVDESRRGDEERIEEINETRCEM